RFERARVFLETKGRSHDVCLDDAVTLLPLLEAFRQRWDTDLENVRIEARFLYDLLERTVPNDATDSLLLDEFAYFLGETARIVGTVSRTLARRGEARRWLDLSESRFRSTVNAAGNIARITYQRLALTLEERELERLSECVPQLVASFQGL